MDAQKLNEAVEISKELTNIFVATADKNGMPHLAVAGKLALDPGGLLEVTSWFCPLTAANLSENKNISLVVWDPKVDFGYQLLGKVEEMWESGILDGYDKKTEEKASFPQVQRKLLVRVNMIIEFKHAPHTDAE
jgi:predicted pyridoxine 5'-phosphate oxidase superfamily flavin-nucleotide-binding protein